MIKMVQNVTGKISLMQCMKEKILGIPANIHDIPFFKEQLKQMNMIPCGYHRYYYREEEMLAHGFRRI